MAVFAEVEVRIAKPPDIEAFRFTLWGNWLRLRDNHRFAQAWILTKTEHELSDGDRILKSGFNANSVCVTQFMLRPRISVPDFSAIMCGAL